MIHPKWQALMNFADENPNCTVKRLDIQDGLPVFLIREVMLYNATTVEIKHKL